MKKSQSKPIKPISKIIRKQYARRCGVAKIMKLVDKLKKAYDYKKELYRAEKGSSSKEDFIELELLQCEDAERSLFA